MSVDSAQMRPEENLSANRTRFAVRDPPGRGQQEDPQEEGGKGKSGRDSPPVPDLLPFQDVGRDDRDGAEHTGRPARRTGGEGGVLRGSQEKDRKNEHPRAD